MLVSRGSHPTEYNTTTEETGKSGDNQAVEDENKTWPHDECSFRTI
jgi:hypothetical protein